MSIFTTETFDCQFFLLILFSFYVMMHHSPWLNV